MTPHTSMLRRNEYRRADDSGFAMITVVLITAVLLVIALTAFGDTGANTSSATITNLTAQADGSANAGVAAALYDINASPAVFPCTLTSGTTTPAMVASTGGFPSLGTDTYSVAVTFSSSSIYSSSSSISCNSGTNRAASTPSSAQIVSTGWAGAGSVTCTTNNHSCSSETITEQVTISPIAVQAYSIFTPNSLSLADLQINQSSGVPIEQGVVYAGSISSTTCAGTQEQATLVSAGAISLTSNHCVIAGNLSAGGTVTLSTQAQVAGNLTTSNGNVVLYSSIVGGSIDAGTSSGSTYGNVALCPKSTTAGPICSAATTSASTTGAINAAGTVTLGPTTPAGSPQSSNWPPTSCTATTDKANGDNNAVNGCITYDSTTAVPQPSQLSLPTYNPPTAAAWAADGYNVITLSSTGCTTSGTTNTLLTDIANATKNTVIDATACSAASGYGVDLSSGPAVKVNVPDYDIIVLANGFNLGSGVTFTNTAKSPTTIPQLTFLVPGPASTSSCSTTANQYNLTLSGNTGLQGPNLEELLYTPCYLSVTSAGVNLAGGAFAGTVTFSSPTQITNVNQALVVPPALNFGYETTVGHRYVSAG